MMTNGWRGPLSHLPLVAAFHLQWPSAQRYPISCLLSLHISDCLEENAISLPLSTCKFQRNMHACKQHTEGSGFPCLSSGGGMGWDTESSPGAVLHFRSIYFEGIFFREGVQGQRNSRKRKESWNNEDKNSRVLGFSSSWFYFLQKKKRLFTESILTIWQAVNLAKISQLSPPTPPHSCIMGRLLDKDIPHSILHRMDDTKKKVKTLNGTSSLGRCPSACHVILTYINTQSFFFAYYNTDLNVQRCFHFFFLILNTTAIDLNTYAIIMP